MEVFFDDIIFSIQKSGGGSVYWSEILKNSFEKTHHIVYANAKQNIFFGEKYITDKKVYSPSLLSVKRFLPLRIKNNEPAIFHSSYYRYAKGKRIKNIVTVHDFYDELYGKGIINFFRKQRKKRTVLRSEGVICISNNTKHDFLSIFPSFRGKVCVIYNGFDDKNYYYEEGKMKRKEFVFVGARTDYKRFDLAVKIVSMCANYKLTIVGGGDLSVDEYNMLDSMIPSRYTKYGFVSNEELRSIYNSSFFLLYPSEYEGFGIPVIEAQACGCPCICQKKSSIPEIAGDAAVFLDPQNLESVISQILELQDKSKYNELVIRGLDNSKKYSWDRCREETKSFYSHILE